jgi:isopenicillin-N epimerase
MTAAATAWSLRPGVTYLNHGSFGPPPDSVRAARQYYQQLLDAEPMDFFVRRMVPELERAAEQLASLVGAARTNLVFVDNATYGMNVVARSIPLAPGDEVLLNDHEYGAVTRLWEQTCRRAGAHLVTVHIPLPLQTHDQIVERVVSTITPRTRLLVISHITSPTAIIFPVEAICTQARQRGVLVCIDGPHALATLPLDLCRLECDFYVASCHKWLSAPFGSGFLYAHPCVQHLIQPAVVSWGRPQPGAAHHWRDEFLWSGTRDPAAFLAVPAALEFLRSFGWEPFRLQTHALARHARSRISSLTGLEPLTPDDAAWYGPMIALPLAPGPAEPLQQALWDKYQIEVPIVAWNDQRLIRVSCHLYNDEEQIDRLAAALRAELK